MKVDVEGAVAVDEAMDVGVEVVVALIGIQVTMKLPLAAIMDFQGQDHQKRETLGSLLRGEVATVALVVVSVGVAVVVLAMETLERVNALVGCMNAAVALVVG